jgi:hypothetical protein
MRSRVSVQVLSCGLSALPGATVASSAADSSTDFGYLAGGAPSMTATQTDTSGIGAWENHPAGATTITVTRGGQKLTSLDLNIRGGVVVVVGASPGM